MSYISTRLYNGDVLVWERDSSGLRTTKTYTAPHYFYVDDPNGKYKTIFDNPVSKVTFPNSKEAWQAKQQYSEDKIRMWESDIGPELRVLSNNYYEVPAPKLNITHLDIEVDYDPERGFSSPKDPYAPINACALYHEHKKEMVALVVPPDDNIDGWTNESLFKASNHILEYPNDEYLTRIEICKNEEELLLKFLDEIEDSDLLSGWNCIPINQSIWTSDRIIKIKDVVIGQSLYQSNVVQKSGINSKQIWTITLENGHIIQASGEHKFPVKYCNPNKYIDFNNNKCITSRDLSVQEISQSSDSCFLELTLRENTNPNNIKYTNEQLYLCGLIYTDGTIHTKQQIKSGFTVYQSDHEMLNNLPLVTSSIIGPHKNNYSRIIKYSVIKTAINLIYDDQLNKRLNIEELSTLSYTQFMYFLSGLLDGDGYISHNTIEWCNYNNDAANLGELCLWNGIFTTIQSNVVRLMNFNYSDLHLLKQSRWKDFKPKFLARNHKQKASSTKFKIKDKIVYVKIRNISQSNCFVDMMDIETDTHYFNSNGIRTHNSDRFDFPYLGGRIKMILGEYHFSRLSFPEGNLPVLQEIEIGKKKFAEEDDESDIVRETQMVLETSGRLLADYMRLYKKYEAAEKPSYKLSSVSEDVLVDDDTEEPLLPKLEYEGSLANLYRANLAFFVRYNIRDTEILHGFEKKLGYVDLANKMYHLSTGQFVHVLGTLKLAELAIVNHCHHIIHRVVPNVTRPEIDKQIEGALVLYPQVGLHDLLGSIDINSLYPTAIRSINISPEKIFGQFIEEMLACLAISRGDESIELTLVLEGTKEQITANADEWRTYLWDHKLAVSGYGTVFRQDSPGIIPTVLSNWFTERKKYQALKKEAAKNHDYELENYYDRLQYVYKIKLNSLYGALSNLYFRFYDLRMGESTTGTGRMILKHQCRKVNEILEGKYDIDIPMYAKMEDAEEKGHSPDVALDGPIFNGKFQSEAVIYGDSVTGDTIIDTERGRKPISELFTHIDYKKDGKEYCNLSTISTWETALTYDKVNNITTYKPIKYVMRHKCSKQLYRVWITNSQWIDVTEDHSLIGYVNTKYRNKYKDIICEIKPQELGNDIKSLIYVKHKPNHNYTEQGFSKELYTLMGLVLGDGYVDTTNTGGVLLSIGNKHISDIENKVLVPLQQEGWISSWTIKPNAHDIQISSTKLRKLLRQELYYTGVKSIPEWMMCESIPNISAFLCGWFSADGFINKNYTIGLCSINEEQIKIAQELLFICGISSTWFTETTENSYKGKYSNTYTKRLTIKSTLKFKELIGFVLSDKQIRLNHYNEGRTKQHINNYDFELVHPIKIEKLPLVDDYVYDIEIADTHMFFANNILVHNTDSTYFKTFTDNVDDAILIADAVAEQVNASYQDFMINTFLCQPEFDNLVKCGREVVSDRGIFVEKKRYMLHLVDVEGKRVDKCKVMGLDTKKTTLPVAVSKRLNKFIERMLKGETWDEISQSVVDYKNELINAKDIMDIGLPKGVKKLEQYTENYKRDRKCFLPGHVAASIFYNQCLEEFDDKVSMQITSGMKIKIFKLKGTFGRFKAIAIPTDAEFVPDWFTENFVVDKSAHILRLVDNPLKNILKAIDEKPPTQDMLTFKSAWEF